MQAHPNAIQIYIVLLNKTLDYLKHCGPSITNLLLAAAVLLLIVKLF